MACQTVAQVVFRFRPTTSYRSAIAGALIAASLLMGAPEKSVAGWWGNCWSTFWSRGCDRGAECDVVASRGKPETATEGGRVRPQPATTDRVPGPPAAESRAGAVSRIADWSCRECLRGWARRRVHVEYGLDRAKQLGDEHAQQSLVVFLHGLNSRPEDLMPLVRCVQRAGFACVTFRYPNDQSLQQSARELAASLRNDPLRRRSICLVTHSMGGLVARAVIEDPALDPGTVEQLIMIAPPTHGSELAKYAVSLDVVEYVSSSARRREAGPIAGGVADGFSEALRDLQPGSHFLERLNARDRNPRVSYSLVAGTAGHVAPAHLEVVRDVLSESSSYCRWMRKCESLWGNCVDTMPEVIDGAGDGVVAVRRAQLAGVDDVLLARIGHSDVLCDQDHPEVDRVYRWIIERIQARQGVMP